MKLWPSDRFDIESSMSPEALAAALSSNVEPRKWFRWSKVHARFQGEVSRDGFEITRIIRYQNSSLPIVRGQFLPNASGTKVAIRMGLHPSAIAFVCVWFGGLGLGTFAFAYVWLSGQASAWPGLLILPAMIVFGFAIVSGGFWFEATKQKPMLIELLSRLCTRS